MPLDRPRRYNIRRVVKETQRLLENEIATRLRYYGIHANGTSLDRELLTHLTSEGGEGVALDGRAGEVNKPQDRKV